MGRGYRKIVLVYVVYEICKIFLVIDGIYIGFLKKLKVINNEYYIRVIEELWDGNKFLIYWKFMCNKICLGEWNKRNYI